VAPAVVAARGVMFRERGWMTEMSVMEMPCGRARRMSPRPLWRMAELWAEVPAAAARPRRRQRGGSSAEAMPALCIAWRKILFRTSWSSVNCAARVEHHMPWSVSERCRVDPQPHCTTGELSGKMVWRGGVGGRSGPLSSGAPELARAGV
jgi:hypothetical protein